MSHEIFNLVALFLCPESQVFCFYFKFQSAFLCAQIFPIYFRPLGGRPSCRRCLPVARCQALPAIFLIFFSKKVLTLYFSYVIMLSYHKKLAWNKRKKPVISNFFKEKEIETLNHGVFKGKNENSAFCTKI